LNIAVLWILVAEMLGECHSKMESEPACFYSYFLLDMGEHKVSYWTDYGAYKWGACHL